MLNAFVTFIVGPPDHENARCALHSHLVSCHTCHTTFNGDMHADCSTINTPCGPGQPLTGPVFLAAALLCHNLPFSSVILASCWGLMPPWTSSGKSSLPTSLWFCSRLPATSLDLTSLPSRTDRQICSHNSSFYLYRPTFPSQLA